MHLNGQTFVAFERISQFVSTSNANHLLRLATIKPALVTIGKGYAPVALLLSILVVVFSLFPDTHGASQRSPLFVVLISLIYSFPAMLAAALIGVLLAYGRAWSLALALLAIPSFLTLLLVAVYAHRQDQPFWSLVLLTLTGPAVAVVTSWVQVRRALRASSLVSLSDRKLAEPSSSARET